MKGNGGSGEAHAGYKHQNEFLGDTKGNRTNPTNVSSSKLGSGESHAAFSHSNEFLGETKGNRDLATNRTSGVSSGHGGGPHKAGG